MSCDPDGTHARHFVTSDLVQTVFQTNKMRAELPLLTQPRQAGSAGLCQTLRGDQSISSPRLGVHFKTLTPKAVMAEEGICK